RWGERDRGVDTREAPILGLEDARAGCGSIALGQAETAARDDVALDLARAAADRVDDRVAVGALVAAVHGRLGLVGLERRVGADDLERGVRDALPELRLPHLVHRGLDRRHAILQGLADHLALQLAG